MTFCDTLSACNSCASACPMGKHGLVLLSRTRVETIRIEMTRSLHDHKKRTDDLVDDLAARAAQLETCLSHCRDSTERAIDEIHAEVRSHKMSSERSAPSRADGVQFFDTRDHHQDIPRPEGLPPAPGSLFPGGSSSIP